MKYKNWKTAHGEHSFAGHPLAKSGMAHEFLCTVLFGYMLLFRKATNLHETCSRVVQVVRSIYEVVPKFLSLLSSHESILLISVYAISTSKCCSCDNTPLAVLLPLLGSRGLL